MVSGSIQVDIFLVWYLTKVFNNAFHNAAVNAGNNKFFMFAEICTRDRNYWYRNTPAMSTPFAHGKIPNLIIGVRIHPNIQEKLYLKVQHFQQPISCLASKCIMIMHKVILLKMLNPPQPTPFKW